MTSFIGLLDRAEKYVTLEEIKKVKKAELKPPQNERRGKSESRKNKSEIRAESSHTIVAGPRPRFEKYTPLRIQMAWASCRNDS